MENTLKRFYTPKEVAEIISISPITVQRMCLEGRLPALKIGREWRIPIEKSERWLENQIQKYRRKAG